MFLPFDQIAFEARVWVYQANRNLTNQEAGTIIETLSAAIEGWEAHGQKLVASAKVFLNRFVVIAVDEDEALPSGCSIDKSTHWLKEIGIQLNIDFFDRSVAYIDENNKIQTVSVADAKKAVLEQEIMGSTTVFDNLVETKAKWLSRWKIRADQSWLKRFFVEIESRAANRQA